MEKAARAKRTDTSTTRQRAELVSTPTWIRPQLAKLVEKAPDGPDWLHELKLDGYRMHARLDSTRVQILTRRGKRLDCKYPAIDTAIAALPVQNAYLDRELYGVLPDGRTVFNLIQDATDTGQGSLVFSRLNDRLLLVGRRPWTQPQQVGQFAAGVTNKLWDLSDMVRVIEEWEVAQ